MQTPGRYVLFLFVGAGLVVGCSGLGPAPPSAPAAQTEARQSAALPTTTSRDQATGGEPKSQASQPTPAAPPAVTSAPAPRDKGALGQSPTQTGSQLAPPGNIKLIPYTGEAGFKVLVPDGWKAQPTALGDLVQWSHGEVRMFVLGTQRHGAAIPHTVDEMKRYMVTDSAAPDAQVKAVKVAGAESAFEVIYSKNDNGGITFLSLYMFGSTYREVLWFAVPTRLYPQWEPLLLQIMQSYQPGNLNAVPLPGRP